MTLYIALAYLLSRMRQTAIAVIGVGIGVCFFLGIFSMMQGMHDYFIDKVINVSPHVVMKDEFRQAPKQPAETKFEGAALEFRGLKPKDELRGIRTWEKILPVLDQMSGISVSPVLQSEAFLRYGGKDESTQLVGIDPEQERLTGNLEKDLIAGSLNNLLTDSNGIIVGYGFIRKLGLRMGAKISVTSPAGNVRKMKVVGIFRTGITSMDNFQSYALLKKVQTLQNKPDVINQIRMRLIDVNDATRVAQNIESMFGYRTEGWEEMNSSIFSIFVIQNGIMYSVVVALTIVAGFGVYNIIFTMVNEKSRDIAIFKSMGFEEADIRKIFLSQGVLIGAVGVVLGWVLGYLLIEFLGSLKFSIKDEGFMSMDGFLLYKAAWMYGLTGSIALVISVISAYLPARKAASMNPVEIIRGAS